MSTLIAILILLVGFIALYYGAEWLVEGAVTIANHLNISKVVAGVILVAFGTSAPELFVNCIAAVRGEASFALSNVSGSNLANLLVGFGLCAIISQLVMQAHKFRTDFIAFIAAPFVLLIIMAFSDATLPVWSVLPLFGAFGYYIYLTSHRMHDDEETDEAEMPFAKGVLWFVIGTSLLYLGGEISVRQAVTIGEALGISSNVLGLTVVALGTSIPDVTASVVAAREGENEIAVGNLLGSNVFNVLFVIPMTLLATMLTGKSALIGDFQVVTNYGFVVLASLCFAIWVLRNDKLQKTVGYVMLAAYFGIMIFSVVQSS